MIVPLGDTYYFKFTTRQSTGAPFTLAGTPALSVYEENNLTQITAGITLTADYDSVTGLNDVAVVATSGNGYEVGKYYDVVITTGTVNSVSAVGEVVGHFRVGPAEDAGAGITDVNVVGWLDTAPATPSTAGIPHVNTTHVSNTAQTANDNGADINDIKVKTDQMTFTTANKLDSRVDNIAGQTVTASAAVTIHPAVGLNSTAQAALEDQFDGTGLIGDAYPARQDQLSGLTISSAALSVGAKASPDGFVLTTGSELNNEDSTRNLDGTRHELTDAAGTLDCYYKFDIGSFGAPVSATIAAVVNGGNDTFGIFVNTGSSGTPSWQQRQTVTGTGSTANVTIDFSLFEDDVVSDLTNEVWIRIYGTGLTTSSFDVDQIFVSRSQQAQYSGYDNGAVWVDTVGGKAGTTLGYNGIASRPVDTFADALTIGTALSTHKYEFSNDSSVTLSATTSAQVLSGTGWTLALGGQDITNTHVIDAKVSGIGTGSSVQFHDCVLTTVTLPDGAFHNCSFNGVFTCSAASVYHFHQSHSGATTPTIDLGAAVGNTTVLMHNWKGAFNVDNLGATGADVIHLAGDGEITLNASCVGGTVNIQGNWKVTNNGSGVTINYDDNTANIASILGDTNELQGDWVNGGRLDLILDARASQATADAIETDTQDIQSRIPAALVGGLMSSDITAISTSTTAADKLEASAETIETGSAITGTLSTTQMTTDLTEATDDHYNGRIIIWTSGVLIRQATNITDYDGTSKLLTYTATTEAPSNGDTFVIV